MIEVLDSHGRRRLLEVDFYSYTSFFLILRFDGGGEYLRSVSLDTLYFCHGGNYRISYSKMVDFD
jgi:hypothetical protein